MIKYKKEKLINWLNIALSVVALILECIPKSVIKAVGPLGDGNYKTSYHSYFSNPSDWNVGLMLAFIVAMVTIIVLIFNLILLIKNNRAIRITSTVFLLLTFGINIFAMGSFATVFNIIISAIFIVQVTLTLFVLPNKYNQNVAKKYTLINETNALLLAIVLVFELIPTSLRIVAKYNYPHNILSNFYYSYFNYSKNWMLLVGCIIGFLTIFMLLFTFITLSRDNKAICIVQLVISSIYEVCNIILLIMAGSSVTPYNIIIAILLIIPIITLSIKLKSAYKTKNLVN